MSDFGDFAQPPKPGGNTTRTFVKGVVLGFVGAILPVVVLALFLGLRKHGAGQVCVVEVLAFLALVVMAWRAKARGLLQGVLVGGAIVFLLCAACWGMMGDIRIAG